MMNVAPDAVDSTGPQHTVTARGHHQWEATHVYDDIVAVTRRFILHVENSTPTRLYEVTRYDDGDGNELNRSETTWEVTADRGNSTQWTVDASDKPVAAFVRNAHYADPVVDIEQALRYTIDE